MSAVEWLLRRGVNQPDNLEILRKTALSLRQFAFRASEKGAYRPHHPAYQEQNHQQQHCNDGR